MSILVGYKTEGKGTFFMGVDSEENKTKIFMSDDNVGYAFLSSSRAAQVLEMYSRRLLTSFEPKENMRKYVITGLIPMWKEVLEEQGGLTPDGLLPEAFLIAIGDTVIRVEKDFRTVESLSPYFLMGEDPIRALALGCLITLHELYVDNVLPKEGQCESSILESVCANVVGCNFGYSKSIEKIFVPAIKVES